MPRREIRVREFYSLFWAQRYFDLCIKRGYDVSGLVSDVTPWGILYRVLPAKKPTLPGFAQALREEGKPK